MTVNSQTYQKVWRTLSIYKDAHTKIKESKPDNKTLIEYASEVIKAGIEALNRDE